ncbi:MAG: hypothetical protein RIT14_1087 [Pseudomonadota bacterium]
MAGIRRILVADDSRAQRRMLAGQLQRWGYDVAEAENGSDALALARATDFDFVLSDWVMPGLTGPELCRAFRALPRDGYGYFVLLSSKSEKDDIADGLDGGADDFLTKPVSAGELRARLRAGERILAMQAEVMDRNRALRRLYDALDRDLAEARRLQDSLVRDRVRDLGRAEVSLLLRPAGHLGGDLVGWFPLTPGKVALYALDVSGHGVASALMTARIEGMLAPHAPGRSLAFRDGLVLPPDAVAARLNHMMAEELHVDQYLTLVYAEVTLATGAVRLVQAGHPHPLVLHSTGFVDRIGTGGFPVGLLPEASYQTLTFTLQPGDRLVIPSDGFTECPGKAGDLGEAGLAALLRGKAGLGGTVLHDALLQGLADHAGGWDFPDDVSAVIFDYRG